MNSGNNSFIQLIKEIPKAEIHLHLEGLVSADSIWNLIQDNNLDLEGIKKREDLIEKFKVKSLDEFIALFINVIQSSFVKNQDVAYLINDAKEYLTRNNIKYAEIFFAVTKFIQTGFSFPFMMDILEAGSRKLYEESGITVKWLIDVSRTFGPENAENNLNLVLENRKPSVIGIGLGGAESSGPAEDYSEVFKKAEAEGLKVVAHAGEDIGPESITAALDYLNAARIGHGISAIQDEALMNRLVKEQIPLEICPTSNLFTRKFVEKIKDHPIKAFFDKGIYVTLNSDDPTLFNSELTNEYIMLYKEGIFAEKEILKIMKNNIFSIFAEESVKKHLWSEAEKVISKYGFTE